MKLTKRKNFSFYRSYYDVFNELPPEDKLDFIEALLDKQFLDIDPENLSGMVKFAYISQMDSIEKQVKGYQDKTKNILNPSKGVQSHPRQGVELTPRQQEKEKEKEKEEDVIEKIVKVYDSFVQEIKDHKHDIAIERIYMRLKVKKGTLTKVLEDYKGQIIIDQKLHRTTQDMLSHFSNYCNTQDRIGKLDEYKTTKSKGAL